MNYLKTAYLAWDEDEEVDLNQIQQDELHVGFVYYIVLKETGRLQEKTITRCSKYNTKFEVKINGVFGSFTDDYKNIAKKGIRTKEEALKYQLERVNKMIHALTIRKVEIESQLDPSKKKEERNDLWD